MKVELMVNGKLVSQDVTKETLVGEIKQALSVRTELDLGPVGSGAPVEMYSFDTPAAMFWSGAVKGFRSAGWTEEQIVEWLQGRDARKNLDSYAELSALGEQFAKEIAK